MTALPSLFFKMTYSKKSFQPLAEYFLICLKTIKWFWTSNCIFLIESNLKNMICPKKEFLAEFAKFYKTTLEWIQNFEDVSFWGQKNDPLAKKNFFR